MPVIMTQAMVMLMTREDDDNNIGNGDVDDKGRP